MRTTNRRNLILAAAVIIMLGALPCLAGERGKKDACFEGPGRKHRKMEEFRKPGAREHHLLGRDAEFIGWLKENYPEEAEKSAKLRKRHPELYQRRRRSSLWQYRRIMEAEKSNPELAEVLKEDLQAKQERDKLLEKIKVEADKAKREKLVKQLEKVVSERFELIIKKKQLRYEKLQQKLEQLKERAKSHQNELEKLREAKKDHIEQRLRELIGEAEEIRWD